MSVLSTHKIRNNDMIKIEFPANNKKLAGVLGRALSEYSESGNTRKDDFGATITERENEGDAVNNTSELESEVEQALKDKAGVEGFSANPDSRVDNNGVSFNAEFCGEAKEPFYASGKNKGQWKKRKGVEEIDYNQWYLDVSKIIDTKPDTRQTDTLDTSGAFGGQKQATEDKQVPKDCGEFMGWVSAQQAAGHLNQHDITDAYAKLKLQVTDLFPPNDSATVGERVRNLHAMLGGLE